MLVFDVVVTDINGVVIPAIGANPVIDNEDATDGVTLESRLGDEAIVSDIVSAPKDINVQLRNDDHKPTNIVGLEWDIEFVGRGARI